MARAAMYLGFPESEHTVPILEYLMVSKCKRKDSFYLREFLFIGKIFNLTIATINPSNCTCPQKIISKMQVDSSKSEWK